MQVGGDTAPVVTDGDGVVVVQNDVDVVAVVGHRFVDGVVHDLVDEVVESALVGAADVHARPPAHGLQAFEDLDVACGVLGFLLFDHGGSRLPWLRGSACVSRRRA